MLRISQNLSLQQKMAPQLIQSLELLQMSTLELEMEVKQQLEINTLLEESTESLLPDEDHSEEPKEALKEEQELPKDSEEVDWDAILEEQFDLGSYNGLNPVAFLCVIWANDSFAYLGGMALGRKFISKGLSPII